MDYANGVKIIIDHTFPNGVRFEGSDGWIFVTRGAERVTASDPIPAGAAAKALQASNPDIFKTPLGKDDVRLHESPNGDHHLDWITSIQTRKPAVTSAEQAHRSTSACITGWIGMKLGRKLKWDPVKEMFDGDDAANDHAEPPRARTLWHQPHEEKLRQHEPGHIHSQILIPRPDGGMVGACQHRFRKLRLRASLCLTWTGP